MRRRYLYIVCREIATPNFFIVLIKDLNVGWKNRKVVTIHLP
jgi:hypothetical protein